MATTDLNFRQQIFISSYLGPARGNATEAARMAGYANPGLAGFRMIKNDKIRAAIDAKVSDAGLTANEVLARLADIATSDMGDFLAIDSKGLPSVDLKRARKVGKLRLIRALRPNRYGMTIELHDSVSALIQLGKYHGLWDGERAPRPPDEGPPPRINPRPPVEDDPAEGGGGRDADDAES
jgi:hypothetical protein